MTKLTKREKRLADLRRKIKRLERDREQGIKLIVKAETQLPALCREAGRLVLKLVNSPVPDAGVVEDPDPSPADHVADDRSAVHDAPAMEEKPSAEPLAGELDELEIPSYLKRSPLAPEIAAAAYAVANTHNKIPTEEQKKLVATEKRKVREEHKQARLTGKTRKPPLTGREAEAFLRQRQR
jgi:hypothetical protein